MAPTLTVNRASRESFHRLAARAGEVAARMLRGAGAGGGARPLARYVPSCYEVRTMRKKLTRTGNSLALVLDRGLLDATGIDAATALEVSTDGEVIVISRVRPARRTERLRKVMDRAHARYAGTFRRLAD